MNLYPFFELLPTSLRRHRYTIKLSEYVRPIKTWGKKDIVIFCGRGFTHWSPKRLSNPKDSFIGGSEEAVILMSKELQKLGWKVTIFGDPGPDEGVYDKVNWLAYYKFNRNDHFNILIGWRMVQFFDRAYNAKQKYLWCEDIQSGSEYTSQRVNNLDKVFLLSKWHYESDPELVKNLPRKKVYFTTNGISFL